MITLSDMLNLNQTPDELVDLYDKDYYWYLRSQAFSDMFLSKIGCVASLLGKYPKKVLDVGCGEGQLAQYVSCGYLGFDGSKSAIDRALNRYRGQPLSFEVARFEDPPMVGGVFTTAVFGGVLEVLVKPEHRLDFIQKYITLYRLQYFIVYDLERLDTWPLEHPYQIIGEFRGGVPEMGGLLDVKRHRKVLVFKVPI